MAENLTFNQGVIGSNPIALTWTWHLAMFIILVIELEKFMSKRNRSRTYNGGPNHDKARIEVLSPKTKASKVLQRVIREFGAESDEVESASYHFLSDHIVSWNWIDDDDGVMQLPNSVEDMNEIFNELTADEMKFIGECIAGKTEGDLKDRKK